MGFGDTGNPPLSGANSKYGPKGHHGFARSLLQAAIAASHENNEIGMKGRISS